jgi:hypothetical protein
VALLSFPSSPSNGQLYPTSPLPGQNQYEYESATQTWRLLGAATTVIPGCYGDAFTVPTFCVDAQGRITSVTNVAIAANTPDLQQVTTQGAVTTDTIDVGGLIAAGLTYPNVDGASGDYLTTDGAGNLSWIAGGTLTSITAGSGLTGGTITTSGTIALDSTAVIPPSAFTAVGDILVGTGAGTYSALPVGTDGYTLSANSSCAEGIEWVVSSGSPATPTVEGTVFALTDSATTLNTALGFDALSITATGAGNVAIGPSAGCALTSGSINTFVGPAAGCAVLDSTQNIGIGFQALGALTTGTGSNIAIGSLAGIALTNENFNVVIGAHPGPAGLDCQIVLADGQGTLRTQINECGAISPDGATYGTCGQFLQSSGATSNWTWANGARVVSVPATSGVGGTLGEVAFGTGFFYFFDGTQWLRVAGNTF